MTHGNEIAKEGMTTDSSLANTLPLIHPMDEEEPLIHIAEEDMIPLEKEVLIGIDQVIGNILINRTGVSMEDTEKGVRSFNDCIH